MTVPPGLILPSASSASSIATPIRSFTDPSGLKNSSLPQISARRPRAFISRENRTSGVPPMVWGTSS